MIRSNYIVAALLTTMVLVGCGGSKRSTSDSSDLTGLWRLNMESDQNVIKAQSNMAFTLTQSGDSLSMVDCATRETIALDLSGDTLADIPLGLGLDEWTLTDNDNMASTGEFISAEASKMAAEPIFDMGEMSLSSPELGSNDFTDLCVLSVSLRILGTNVSEGFSATTMFNGEPLTVSIIAMGLFAKGDYNILETPAADDASITILGEGLQALFGETELTLRDGTLTVTVDSTTESDGTFSGTLPNGSTLTGTFGFENP